MAETTTCKVTLNQRPPLDCRPGMTLFAALRTHKILLPTGCGARGLCGQCKVRLVSGPADLLADSEVRLIPEEERAQGYRLGCQLRLSGDISVEIPEYVFGATQRKAVLASVTPLTADIRRFSFALADGDRIPHLAGQFVNLSAKIPGTKTQAIRCFSFATPASVEDRVELIIRLNPHGVMTPYLFEQAKPGDEMSLTAPYGDFHLRDGDAPCVWIAGGSGLSPFLGMIQDLLDKGDTTRHIHLFFGAVHPSDLYYVDMLNEISSAHPWFQFTPALSGNERTDYCHDYGLITDVVARHIANASGAEGYICGSPGMIGACLKVLGERGMERKNIYYDRF